MFSRYPNNWRMIIQNVRKDDQGIYVCQIASFPPKMLIVNLNVKGKYIYYFTILHQILISKWNVIRSLIVYVFNIVQEISYIFNPKHLYAFENNLLPQKSYYLFLMKYNTQIIHLLF